jgi:hypothetical protein
LGLEKAKEHPDKVVQGDVITVRRIIYQSMMQAFQHGQIIANPIEHAAELGPNLAIIPKVSDAYETMMREDPNDAHNIAIGHRNFLLDATYYLYEANRVPEAKKWYDDVRQKYPDKTILQNDPDSFPGKVPLDIYCVERVQGDVKDTSHDDTQAAIEGMLIRSYENLAIGQDDRYEGFRLLALKIWENYMNKMRSYKTDIARVGLDPFPTIDKRVLSELLDPVNGLPYGARAVIRSELRIPGDPNSPYGVISTNSVVKIPPSTNAPAGPVSP